MPVLRHWLAVFCEGDMFSSRHFWFAEDCEVLFRSAKDYELLTSWVQTVIELPCRFCATLHWRRTGMGVLSHFFWLAEDCEAQTGSRWRRTGMPFLRHWLAVFCEGDMPSSRTVGAATVRQLGILPRRRLQGTF